MILEKKSIIFAKYLIILLISQKIKANPLEK